ncbi:MAG: hypothetical protein KC910_05050 [Candidatus Eremiobacteraeota bacterium]|nr:hypothetical protein [Candidatus Eremiobacteraeota bacterium]
MKISNLSQPRQAARPLATPTQSEPPAQKESYIPYLAAGVVGLGTGYLGANVGAVAGMELGILLTRPESGLGDLLINMARGAQIGLVVGAVAFAAAGGALAYIAADELLKNQG